MDHFIQIYSSRAADYHRMIAPEDSEGNLLKALQAIAPIRNQRVLDLGTGTGRLPLLLGREAKQVVGVDLHWDMLKENQRQRGQAAGRWGLVNGDMRVLPFPSGWADVVTAGWAIGHLCGWYAEDWQTQIGQVLAEMQRVATTSGVLLIMETLTTGSLTPAPPTEGLAQYYAWLESEWGFARQTIRTDYAFASVEDAAAKTDFFFGAELAAKIRANRWVSVPEWTGVWSKVVGS
jgi:ubiquinone/menaquinone biosynthesis C-methylase UbiE